MTLPAARLIGHARSLPRTFRRVVAAFSTADGRRALRHGVAATMDPQPMLRRLAPSFVLDVGANRGQFALDVLRAVPRARIVSIEPLASEAETFRRILGHVARIELIECAAGPSCAHGVLHVSRAADSSSLLMIGPGQRALFPGTDEVTSVSVPVLTIAELLGDQVVPPDSLLKIDVQGFELEVLRGAQHRLRSFRWVYVEVSFVELYKGQALAPEVFEYLQRFGFFAIDTGVPVRRGGRTVQLDVLMERVEEVVR